jgi:hypothetical protein
MLIFILKCTQEFDPFLECITIAPVENLLTPPSSRDFSAERCLMCGGHSLTEVADQIRFSLDENIVL